MHRDLSRAAVAALLLLALSTSSRAADSTKLLADGLRPFLQVLSGSEERFSLTAEVQVAIDKKPQSITMRLDRFDKETFDLQLIHSDYSVRIRRDEETTWFVLPKHKVAYVGRGDIDDADNIAPTGIAARLVSAESMAAIYVPLATQGNAEATALLLTGLLNVQYDEAAKAFKAGKSVSFRFGDDDKSLSIESKGTQVELGLAQTGETPDAADRWPGMRVVELKRDELERQLSRGVRRAFEILAPSPRLTSPVQQSRKVANGELRWVNGQRIALLRGTPEEIGRAHGELLQAEAGRCIDSVLYTFGTAQTIRTGRWFRHDLEAAYARLSPHIPDDHKRETRALAKSLGYQPELAEALNVFPELFHCSGFAVFGKATKNGKLYHGRVLDYMTTIGLQDAATTFVVAVDGKIPFANVGYAGFIGSVSGMNDQQISLGEMGGRGEGQWDGVPMATLMRRALEECRTLDEVIDLWKRSPRTCEYYYVFADGKTRRAVGVAATPKSIEFVQPGAAHPLLGDGIEDAIVLSAGSRLQKLRERVTEKHGEIDADIAQWLMSRPVAMQSNLHNVLFVPEDGILYVANADHKRPAAERPYVRIELQGLLRELPGEANPAGD